MASIPTTDTGWSTPPRLWARGRYRFAVYNLLPGASAHAYGVGGGCTPEPWPSPFLPAEVDPANDFVGPAAVLDATGDGRKDVVALARTGIWIYPQLPDGTL